MNHLGRLSYSWDVGNTQQSTTHPRRRVLFMRCWKHTAVDHPHTLAAASFSVIRCPLPPSSGYFSSSMATFFFVQLSVFVEISSRVQFSKNNVCPFAYRLIRKFFVISQVQVLVVVAVSYDLIVVVKRVRLSFQTFKMYFTYNEYLFLLCFVIQKKKIGFYVIFD